MSKPRQDLHVLPLQRTSFIGRNHEIMEIRSMLTSGACRLLTLVGPGGIGKTRLALEIARALRESFADGTVFVPLQPVAGADDLSMSIATALDLPLAVPHELRAHVVRYLQNRQILLLLDNFEHVVEEAPRITEILSAAPQVACLVTSREALNLEEEWLYPLDGLTLPASAAPDSIEQAHAAQLFAARAQRVNPRFMVGVEAAAVARICHLVEGMPLALELAATWTKTLSCAMIAAEIERNLAFLTTPIRNLPERHRSVRAAFDGSWQRLTPDERACYMRLSVFQGGFTFEAAAQVAQASLPLLATFVDKSLLRRAAHDRYQIHELLRQYAADHLRDAPNVYADTLAAHQAYYIGLVTHQCAAMMRGNQVEAMRAIGAEIDNIRPAIGRAIAQGNVAALDQVTNTLSQYYFIRGPYQEAVDLFSRAARCLHELPASPAVDNVLADVLRELAYFYIRLGQVELARRALVESEALFQRHDTCPPPGIATDPQIGLGLVALIEGNYLEAGRRGEQAMFGSQEPLHSWNHAVALYILANVTEADGRLEPARQYAQQACRLVEAVGDRWFMAYCLNTLGSIAAAAGAYAEAARHFQASYAIREEFADAEGMALALALLGKVAVLQGQHHAARELYERSLGLYHNLGDRGGHAAALNGLGIAARGAGDPDGSRTHFRAALEIAAEMRYVPLVLTILTGIGEWLVDRGALHRARCLLSVVHTHPAADHGTRQRAQRLLPQDEARLGHVHLSKSMTAQADQLEELVQTLLHELALPADRSDDALPPVEGVVDADPLLEPLTERERAILACIGEGLSNQAIADRLILSLGTVKWYTSHIYGKLGVQTRTQAVARARTLGVLP